MGSIFREAYPSSLEKEGEEELILSFERGELCRVNGECYTDKIEAIRRVEALASAWAIGRDTHVGDTIVGIKGRVGFEAAAPLMIIKAHELLENIHSRNGRCIGRNNWPIGTGCFYTRPCTGDLLCGISRVS